MEILIQKLYNDKKKEGLPVRLLLICINLKYRVSDQASEASAIGATYISIFIMESCDTQGIKINTY